MIAGQIYIERGQPVTVLCGWGDNRGEPALTFRYFRTAPARNGPRNVLIRRADDTTVVRTFRGLRKPKENNA